MPSIEKRCHELRIQDRNQIWRIMYAIEPDAIVVLEVFSKKLALEARVKELRLSQRLTQVQLAKAVGSSQSRIAKLSLPDHGLENRDSET